MGAAGCPVRRQREAAAEEEVGTLLNVTPGTPTPQPPPPRSALSLSPGHGGLQHLLTPGLD